MIVPMYKYVFLVHHSAYKGFLKDIRKIGVVHISTTNNEPTPEMQDILRHHAEVVKAFQKLNMIHADETGDAPGFSTGQEVFVRLKTIEKEIEHNQQQIVQLDKEKRQLIPWGDFEWEKVKKLENNGLKIRFMSTPIRRYDTEWEEVNYIHIISDHEGYRYFVKIEKKENGAAEEEFEMPGVEELVLPRKSLSQVNAEIDNLQKNNDVLKREMRQIAFHCKPLLSNYQRELQQSFSEQNALLQTAEEVEGKVKLLEGWVPEIKKSELDTYLEENHILHTCEEPADDDKVPILLENNRFSRLYEIIGELYDLPNHKELDLVPFFAPFYMMFFGFALGDAGYGLFIIIAAQLMKRKFPNIKSVLSLAQWLGLGTVIFGALTGTFFGIALADAKIPFLEGAKDYMISTDQLFSLSIIVGAIQVLFGMVLKVFNITRVKGFLYSLSTIGWLILLIGLASVWGLKTKGVITPETAGLVQTIIFVISGILILLLNNPKRNIFINVGAGLWDIYGMTTGLLGDLLSYVRLFALGISSAILGMVFNNMAMSLKPDIVIVGPLVMIIILLAGHGITIFMSGLGAFVHPIRLTFVEFYKNAGFTGGGKAYTPFSEPASSTTE